MIAHFVAYLKKRGHDTANESFIEEATFAFECLRAASYTCLGEDHSFHDLLNENIRLLDGMNLQSL